MFDPSESTSIVQDCAWAAGGTDIGEERSGNEDALLCAPERGVFVVADGMGGQAAGERASALAIRVLHAELTTERLRTALREGGAAVQMLLNTALATANDAILQLADDHPEWNGMGTTAVVAILDVDQLYIANVGDSRAYLLRGKSIQQLTRDHTLAAMLGESEGLSADEVRAHPLRNRLTMILGSREPLNPAFTTLTLQRGDQVILCSDGLWDMLEEIEMVGIMRFCASPREAVYSLIGAANTAGGDDNITVITIFH